MYIFEKENWTEFTYDTDQLIGLLSKVRNLQGRLFGTLSGMGFEFQNETILENLTLDIVKSSEIEGEILNQEMVRSSVARNLGLEISGLIESDRNVDGMVEMMLDAVTKHNNDLTEDRLFAWHSALFPTGRSGMLKIIAGNYRDDNKGPMQVISGAYGRETIHYQAPDAKTLKNEMEHFLNWVNSKAEIDPVIKAGIAHFWFVSLHPFEDGNGRIARAVTDMMLARADNSGIRYYSMSTQIRKERNHYYDILEFSQKADNDLTKWLQWFLECLYNSLLESEIKLTKVIQKANFWNINSGVVLNQRQIKIINKLLSGFEGNLTTSKYAKICKCSPDSALRDIQDLIEKNVLIKSESGGRSTNYLLK